MRPFRRKGDMISKVEFDSSTWNELPWKFEAGTSPTAEAWGSARPWTISCARHGERAARMSELTAYALRAAARVEGAVRADADRRGGVVSFAINTAPAPSLSSATARPSASGQATIARSR